MKNWNEKLSKAVEQKSLFCIKRCLFNGADIHYNNDNTIDKLSGGGCLNIIEYLFEKYDFTIDALNNSLISAVYMNHIDVVVFLIEHGANLHKKHEYIMRHAFTYKHYDMITILLKYNAPITQCIDEKDKQDYLNYMRKNKLNNLNFY